MIKNNFLLTCDVDWASEEVLKVFCEDIIEKNIRPLFFCTHSSKILDHFYEKNLVDIGIHPNFKKNSSHGSNIKDVINNIYNLFPDSKISRSHGFIDSVQIQNELFKKKILFDSNKLEYHKVNIKKEKLNSGILRISCFWSDGWTLRLTNSLENELSQTSTLLNSFGFKIFNLHPINYVMNCKSLKHYSEYSKKTTTLNKNEILKYRNTKEFGISDYFNQILKKMSKNNSFSTFESIFNA